MNNQYTQDCPNRAAGCVINCPEYAVYKVEIEERRAERDREVHRRMDYAQFKREAIQRAKGKSYKRNGDRIEPH